ncbi:MAG: hypothetical protein ACHQ50_12605 [Fimbriimonadales bacterium]
MTLAVALAFCLHGQTGSRQSQLPPADGQAILDRYYSLVSGAQTIHYIEQVTLGGETVREEGWLMRPRLFRSVISSVDAKGRSQTMTTFMTANEVIDVDLNGKTYDLMDRSQGSPFLNGFEPFNESKRPAYTQGGKVFHAVFDGKPAFAIETGPQSIPGSLVYVYADATSLAPAGWEYSVGSNSEFHTYEFIKFNERMSAKDFDWKPTKGFKLRRDMRMPKHKG